MQPTINVIVFPSENNLVGKWNTLYSTYFVFYSITSCWEQGGQETFVKLFARRQKNQKDLNEKAKKSASHDRKIIVYL